MFSGGALERLSIFALGIMPYISASIVMQMATHVVEPLKQLRKEGEAGRRKITQYTRYGPSLLVEGASHEAGVARTGEGRYAVSLDGRDWEITLREALPPGASGASRARVAGPERVTAPMPGKILKLLVEPGQAVEAGQGLVVMEAMKMENELKAPRAGTLRELGVSEGDAVETGALLALLE
jgi:biotin carboxyl carrier protein